MTFSEKSDIIKVQKRKREEKSQKNFSKKIKKDLTNKVESDIIKMSKGENNSLRYKKNRVATNAKSKDRKKGLL